MAEGRKKRVEVEPVKSAAVPLLEAALRSKRWSQHELARQIGTTGSVVSRWLSGQRKPGRRFSIAIEEALGVDAALWDVRSRRQSKEAAA